MFVQMKRIGNDTLFIAAAIALFIGMVLALHSGYSLRRFDFEQALASIVALSIVKEMGPVITGLLLAGRIGASVTAEIGTMQVNEEIDALHTHGHQPGPLPGDAALPGLRDHDAGPGGLRQHRRDLRRRHRRLGLLRHELSPVL